MVYSYFLNWVLNDFFTVRYWEYKVSGNLKKKKIEEEVSENLGVDN